MAEKAECADIVQVALTSAFAHGEDVICVPETSAAGHGLHAVKAKPRHPSGAASTLEGSVGGDRVDLAGSTASSVAGEDLVAEITWIGAQAPLVDAVVTAEGAAAFRQDLELAPAAERKTVRAFGESVPRGVSTRQSAGKRHWFI
jgi:hypothetical protein